MTEQNLNDYFKKEPTLTTDIGDFSYEKWLGEGGNSFVFLFKKGNQNFAIKFLKPNDQNKLKRFKDEYFCAIQIPSHNNVVQPYHFDRVILGDVKYFIIIMKHYSTNLNEIKPITNENEENKSEKSWKLFQELMKSIKHLHDHSIIHRDIKPQNIFFDKDYVLGDLGIAHFADDQFIKESKTESKERLSNYLFSAPEQKTDSKKPITKAADVYALGQVMQWYLTGRTVGGLDRSKFSSNNSPKKLQLLDEIVEICLRDDHTKRFQSISRVKSFIEEKIKPKRDVLEKLYDFNNVIGKSFPKIDKMYQTSKTDEINRFINNFNEGCRANEFWYMDVEGGDFDCKSFISLGNNKWLFNERYELSIEQLIVYKHHSQFHKHFFVLLIEPNKPFDIVDNNNNPITRELGDLAEDWATYYDGKYIDFNEIKNGYYDNGSEIIPVDPTFFPERIRHLKKYAYIIAPIGNAICSMERDDVMQFLKSIIEKSEITDNSLTKYLDAAEGHYSKEFTMRA